MVQFNPKPLPPITVDTQFCNPIVLTVADLNVIGTNILWYTSLLDSVGRSIPQFESPQLDGVKVFYVSQTIDKCESDRVSFNVDILSKPIIYFSGDSTICEDETVVLNVPFNAELYTWIPQSNNNTLSIDSSGTYYLFASNFCGFDSDSIIINVINCSTVIGIPNIFTPNNDGTNDTFSPFGENFSLQEIVIFNRWGQQIYSSRIPWDGMIGGEDATSSTYFYIIKIIDANDEIQVFKGNVSLFR